MTTRQRVSVVVLVCVALLVGIAVGVLATLPRTDCSPEARQVALRADTSQVLAGGLTIAAAVEREQARINACEN